MTATNKLVIKFLEDNYGAEAVELWKEKAEKQFLSLSNNKKDPKAPTKPSSAYNFFMKEKMAEMKKKEPEAKLPELSKKIGEEWAKIKGDSKKSKKYNDLAASDKDRYAQEMETYQPPEGFAPSKKVKKEGPKGPKGPYICFSMDVRPSIVKKNPNASPSEVMKLIGEAWKEVKDDKKKRAKYDEMAAADKERYESEKGQDSSKTPAAEKKTVTAEAKKGVKGKKALASKKVVAKKSDEEDEKPKKGAKGKKAVASKKVVAKKNPKPTLEEVSDEEDEE